MAEHRIYSMSFASVYPLYVKKVERKGKTEAELREIITWLTGYSEDALTNILTTDIDFRQFFAEAPVMNPSAPLITGVICGVRVEEIEDPLMQQIRWLDKLVDELARGKKMESILRQPK